VPDPESLPQIPPERTTAAPVQNNRDAWRRIRVPGAHGARALLATTPPILALVVIVDLLWPPWDTRNHTLHDKLTSTVVVTTRSR